MEPNSLSVRECIRTRRTIHNFLPEPPPEDVILEAIESARWAPNHKLTQPWRFYVVGPATGAKISELNAELVTQERGEHAGQVKLERWLSMPAWLVVTCRRSEDDRRFMEDYAATACAIENLMLDLWAQGIGAKWGTGSVTRHPDFFRLIGADPDLEMVVGMFWYGYPAETRTTERLPLDDITRRVP